MKRAKLSADRELDLAIRLIELLNASDSREIPIDTAYRELNVSESELCRLLDLLASISDSRTGLRLPISLVHGSIRMEGDAGTLRLLRLDGEESAVLAHLLHALNIDEAARRRIAQGLLPIGAGELDTPFVAEPPRYGSCYQALSCAIEDGVRLRILYRSHDEDVPTERCIDPHLIAFEDGAAYLIAWDVQKSSQRRYRLDRIARVTVTEDSAERHPFREQTLSQSLAAHGQSARLLFESGRLAREVGWRGLHDVAAQDQADPTASEGPVTALIDYSSEAWLLDQVLSQGGRITIVAPERLRAKLAERADLLLGRLDS